MYWTHEERANFRWYGSEIMYIRIQNSLDLKITSNLATINFF